LHIPACDPRSAYRVLEKHDVLMAGGADVFAYVARERLSLVEIA
jgi:hypothetical protein